MGQIYDGISVTQTDTNASPTGNYTLSVLVPEANSGDVAEGQKAYNSFGSLIIGTNGKNPYNYIKQIADYLFDVQYSTVNIDYEWANNYFSPKNTNTMQNTYGACTGIVKDKKVLRHLDYYYDNNAEFIVRRVADPEAINPIASSGKGTHASIGIATGIHGLTKSAVESGKYNEKFKLLPFGMSDGINDAGLYIQQNVVPQNGIVYNINPTSTQKCCITMMIRYLLDHCANFADVETALNTVNIYSTDKIAFGFHFLIADSTGDWRVIEFTANGHKTVGPTGTTGVDSTMPNGIMTNFRTTDLTFTGNNVDWSSVEQYGIGVERYDIATQAFATSGAKTFEELRPLLKYSNLYTNYEPSSTNRWKTEFSGSTIGGHTFVVMDAAAGVTTYDAQYNEGFATEHNNYITKTRDHGNGVWETTHSAIYDLANKSLNVAIQERFDKTYDFALSESLSDKLDKTKCTCVVVTSQSEFPTSAINDGGVHIIYSALTPETKYAGYIYLIAEV